MCKDSIIELVIWMTRLQRPVTSGYSLKTLFLSFSLILIINFSSGNISAEEYHEGSIDTLLPQPLKDSDVKLYQQIFALQEIGEIKEADKLVSQLSNRILVGHIQSQRYLHPNAWRSSYDELRIWLSNYPDHPNASRISWLAKKRKPKSASNPNSPKKGYLNGVGQNKPQRWRASIPESYAGRVSPRQTASIAYQVRRSNLRREPTNASKFLSNPNSLRFLTPSEEAHLRGEIAHAYFIYGLDDKAIMTARQAISKSPQTAYMGYWAAGLALYRSYQYDLAGIYLRTLANMDDAPEQLRSSAAFWAYRLSLRENDPKNSIKFLNIAKNFPDCFYGMMALQISGQKISVDFRQPEVTDDFVPWLSETRGGRRILALLQIGDWAKASRELRYLYGQASLAQRKDMMMFAVTHNMPGLAFRLADLHFQKTGESFYLALYPQPETHVSFDIDPAIIYGIIRKESSFYPLARSRARASGLMQIMPATAAFISKDRSFLNVNRHLLNNPDINLKLGQDYILHLLENAVVDQHLFKLLAAYNAGPGNLNKWLKKIDHREDSFLMLESIPARETRGYVKSVTMNIWMYRLKEGASASDFRTLVAGEGTSGEIAFLKANVGSD